MNARKGIIEWLEDNINEDKQRGLTDTAIMYQNTLNLIEKQQKEIEKKDKQLKGLEEIDKRRTWTVNKVISEYIPDYEIISLINRYKDESFIPRVEVEKILNDRKKYFERKVENGN